MGIPIFLAGDERLAGPWSSFMLHRPKATIGGETQLDASALQRLIVSLKGAGHPDVPALRKVLEKLEADEARTTAIYADRTPLHAVEVSALKAPETVLDAEEAVTKGIAHRVEAFELPSGHSLVSCGSPNLSLTVTTPPRRATTTSTAL